MKIFYLIGKDIDQSLSPYIHNYIFKLCNINAEYKIKPLNSKDEMRAIFSSISKGEIYGINITNPYKISALDYINNLDSVAQKIRSINCVTNERNQLKGFNTDWGGFVRMIKNMNILNANIIGYGGAGRAVEYALLSLGIKNIKIYTRLRINHKQNIIYDDINDIFHKKRVSNSLIVNATPIHFVNNNNFEKSIDFSLEKIFRIDLLYTKLSTEKETYFNETVYKNGLDMLIYQAFESIKIWFRKDMLKDVDFSDLKSYLERVNDAI